MRWGGNDEIPNIRYFNGTIAVVMTGEGVRNPTFLMTYYGNGSIY